MNERRDHASAGVLSDERVSEYESEFGCSEGNVCSIAAHRSYALLESEQRFVDLRSLHPRLPIRRHRVRSSFVTRQVDQRKLPMQLTTAPSIFVHIFYTTMSTGSLTLKQWSLALGSGQERYKCSLRLHCQIPNTKTQPQTSNSRKHWIIWKSSKKPDFFRRKIWKMACERDELLLADVCPAVRNSLPLRISSKTYKHTSNTYWITLFKNVDVFRNIKKVSQKQGAHVLLAIARFLL